MGPLNSLYSFLSLKYIYDALKDWGISDKIIWATLKLLLKVGCFVSLSQSSVKLTKVFCYELLSKRGFIVLFTYIYSLFTQSITIIVGSYRKSYPLSLLWSTIAEILLFQIGLAIFIKTIILSSHILLTLKDIIKMEIYFTFSVVIKTDF